MVRLGLFMFDGDFCGLHGFWMVFVHSCCFVVFIVFWIKPWILLP
jgi:hypothetical protein